MPHRYRMLVQPGQNGAAGKYKNVDIELSLFDMEQDPFATTNVIGQHPEIAVGLKAMAEQHRERFYAAE